MLKEPIHKEQRRSSTVGKKEQPEPHRQYKSPPGKVCHFDPAPVMEATSVASQQAGCHQSHPQTRLLTGAD